MKIGITNLKGGVGKTTIAVNLAVCFAHSGYKVCLVDTDTNQNSMAWYGARDEALPEITVVGVTDHNALSRTVANLHRQHDIIIIDGTPSLSQMSSKIIIASDLLLIPTRPQAHDYRAMRDFMAHLSNLRTFAEDVVAVFVINEFDERYRLHNTVKKSLAEYELPIMETHLKSRTVYGESNMNGTGVFEEHDTKAKDEMIALTNEVVKLAQKLKFLN